MPCEINHWLAAKKMKWEWNICWCEDVLLAGEPKREAERNRNQSA